MSTLPAKRKRAQICYAEPSDDFFDSTSESGEAITMEGCEDDDLPDDDAAYGSRKKPGKTNKTKANKRAKFSAPKPKKPTRPLPFLSLPAELRDYIYELALTEEGGLSLVSKTKAYRRTIARGMIYDGDGSYYLPNRRTRRKDYNDESDEAEVAFNHLSPNILAVNKQIHSEAIGYLYKQPLVLEDTMALHTFIAAIGPTNRLRISDLTVRGWGSGRGTHKAMNVASLTMLAGCTNLKSFNLDCNIGWLRAPKHLARQIYRDGHYFLEAYGAAHGRKDAAVEVLQLNEWNYDRGNYYSWRRSGNTLPGSDEFKKQFQAEMRKLLGS